MKLRRTRVLLAAGLLVGVGWSGTVAEFGDSDSIDGSFATGTVSLTLTDPTPPAALFTVSNAKPGDTPTYHSLKLTNAGSLGLTYVMETSATNPDTKNLAGSVQGHVRVVPSATCDQTAFDASATTLTGATALGSLADSSSRSLAAAAVEYLCFKVWLPSTATDAVQGATTTATFTFVSTQA